MRRLIYLIACLAGVLAAGCYADKGNYDYVDINEMQVNFTPEAGEYNAEYYSYSYTYRQPATEPLSVTYKAGVAQSVSTGDANLEYEWIVTKNSNAQTRDTVRSKELTLEYAPKVKTTYDVRFRVRDTNTGIDLYRSLRMVTEVPFIKSWFVFHGEPGSRMLGAVEYPDRGVDAEVSPDAYETLHGQPAPFSDAVSMMYMAADGYNISSYEHLTFLAPNKFYYMPAFDLVLSARSYATAMPEPAAGLKISYGVTNNSIGYAAILVTEDGQFVHGGPNGFYYKTLTQPDLGGYHVDKAYLSTERYLTIWDDVNKRFLYYNMGENWYYNWHSGETRPSGVSNQALLTPFPEELIADGSMNDYQMLWMGQPVTANTESGGFAIVKDEPTGDYWAYMISYGGDKDKDSGGDDGMSVTRQKLTGM